MMNKSGIKFSGDTVVHQSYLRARRTSESIVKNEVNRIAIWNLWSLGVGGSSENTRVETKRLNIDILGMSEIKWKEEGNIWSDN
jgi:hypothetical protein